MKVKTVIAAAILLCLVSWAGFASLVSNHDQAVIDFGIRQVSLFEFIAKGSFFAAVFLAFLLSVPEIIKKILKKQTQEAVLVNEKNERSQKDWDQVISHLGMKAEEAATAFFRDSASCALSQLKALEACIRQFETLYIDENTYVFEEVATSLGLAKNQMAGHAKSILNRINVEGEPAALEKKLTLNQKILDDVKTLLGETVDYLDNKAALKAQPLENVLYSLRALNETLEEKGEF